MQNYDITVHYTGRRKVYSNGTLVLDVNRGTWLQRDMRSGIVSGSHGPDWKKKLRDGLLTGDMDVTITRDNFVIGTHDRTIRRLSDGFRQRATEPSNNTALSVSFPLDASKLNTANVDASRRFTEEVYKHRNAMLGELLAESKTTAALIGGHIRTVVEFVQDARRSGLRVLRSYDWSNGVPYRFGTLKGRTRPVKTDMNEVLDRIASGYLQVVFVYRPLIADIATAANAILEVPPVVKRKIKGSAAVETRHSTLSPPTYTGYAGMGWVHTSRAVEKAIMKYMTILRAERSASLPEQLGLLPRDFIPTLYELVPFSWAIDYVTNLNSIVSWFSTYAVGGGVGPIQRTRVITQEVEARSYDISYAPSGWVTESNSFGETKLTSSRRWIRRDKVSYPAMPSPILRGLSRSDQAANLAAVAKLLFLRSDTIRQSRLITHPFTQQG
jgi:hypothetical protein